MKLPVPIKLKETIYTECEVVAPTVNIIGQTRKTVESGQFFASMRPFCGGCITEFKTLDGAVINDPVAIKSLIPKIPYRSVEYISLQAILKHYSDDDGIEGVYYCPRCGAESLAEFREEDGTIIDTRDHISSLEVGYFDLDSDSFEITVTLAEPVVIIDKKDNTPYMEITSLTIEIPTLEHCIQAESKVGNKDAVKLQLAIYVEALTKVNGELVDNKFRTSFGMYIFGNIRSVRKDLGTIATYLNRLGLKREVKKECHRCGKVWEPTVNTSNFFVSAPLTF